MGRNLSICFEGENAAVRTLKLSLYHVKEMTYSKTIGECQPISHINFDAVFLLLNPNK